MNSKIKNFLRLSAISTAVLAVLPVLAGEGDDDVKALVTPTSEISVGAGYVSQDNQRFGEYTGLNKSGGYGLIDLDVIKRMDSTGTWIKLRGRNLGLDSREIRFENERQGNWGYFIEYNQIPRFDPYTVTTQLSGIGTSTLTINEGGTPSEYHLKTERKIWSVGFDKELMPGLGLQVRYKHDDKDGSRLYGQGTFSTWRFLTDPINYTTEQAEAILNYANERFQLRGGYYGTWYRDNNNNQTLDVLAGTGTASVVFNPMALPPSNQSHQFYLSGGYNFTKATRGNFKVAIGRITQDNVFPTPAVPGNSNLDGKIDTTLVQVGLTSRPIPKLWLRADFNYQDRHDKTPVMLYWPSQDTPTSTNNGENEPRDITTTTAKAEAAYRLPMGFRLRGDVTWQEKKRNSPPVRSVNFREKTYEWTYGIELRRAIAETLTGAVAYVYSERDGSDWLPTLTNGGLQGSELIDPLHLIDRDRDLVKLTLNWLPIDTLSLNFRLDYAHDNYKGRGIGGYDLGPRDGKAKLYSLDAAYSFSEAITATAWYTYNDNQYEDAICRPLANDGPNSNVCTANDARPVWNSELKNVSNSFGIGLRAKPMAKLDIGFDVVQSKVRDEITTSSIDPAVSSAIMPLNDINTKVTTFRLFGKYALDKQSGVRVEYVHDRYKSDDWTWSDWTYTSSADGGTTVLQDGTQNVDFVGVAYYYRFQ